MLETIYGSNAYKMEVEETYFNLIEANYDTQVKDDHSCQII